MSLLDLIPGAKWLPVAAGALLGGAVVSGVILTYDAIHRLPAAVSRGRALERGEAAADAQKQELERKGDDAKLQRMSRYDLCVAYLGRVPDCDALQLQPVRPE